MEGEFLMSRALRSFSVVGPPSLECQYSGGYATADRNSADDVDLKLTACVKYFSQTLSSCHNSFGYLSLGQLFSVA
jgi:hypothetical protein